MTNNTEIVRYVMTDYPYNWRDGDFDDWLNELKREGWVDAKKNPADFIAAVETELNGIFISRDELPEVISGKYDSELAVLDSNGEKTTMAVKSDTSESLRSIGLAFLAMASYREKNPPVLIDQKQVDTLARILDEKIISHEMPGDIARRLLASGKITVSTD